MTETPYFLDRPVERIGALADGVRGTVGAILHLSPRQVDGVAHTDQDLRDAVMKLARDAGALLFLRIDDALGQFLELAVRQPAFVEVEHHPAPEHQQHRRDRDKDDRKEG